MANIYAGAHVVLAATYSPDGSRGLFAHKQHKHGLPIFTGYNKDNSIFEIYCRSKWTHYYVDGQHESWQPYYDIGGEERQAEVPLLNRGWAFQERLLASRYIRFMADELVWECRSSTACECKFLELASG
jgi:hypothetical protein